MKVQGKRGKRGEADQSIRVLMHREVIGADLP